MHTVNKSGILILYFKKDWKKKEKDTKECATSKWENKPRKTISDPKPMEFIGRMTKRSPGLVAEACI